MTRRSSAALFVFLALSRLTTVPAQAEPETGPSFDCSRAATATEKAICGDMTLLGYMDRTLAALYSEARQGEVAGLARLQKRWLAKRDACGADAACLSASYLKRLKELSRDLGDESGVSGGYGYQLSDETNFGEMWLARHADGSLSGGLQTVSGPTFHLCTVEFSNAEAIGDAWIWHQAKPGGNDRYERCTVLLRRQPSGIRIDSIGCRQYCGARGWFDADYTSDKTKE